MNALALVLALGLADGAATEPRAAGPRIDHQPARCVLEGRLAVVRARIEPDGADLRARLFFRESAGATWYWVDMERQDGAWTGVLPRPSHDALWVAYVIEAQAGATGAKTRFPDPPTAVAEVVTEPCPEGTAPTVHVSEVRIHRPANAPPLPAGFEIRGTGAVADAGEPDLPPLPRRIGVESQTSYHPPESPIASGDSIGAPLVAGSKIRVRTSDDSALAGRFVAMNETSLTLRTASSLRRIDRDKIVALDTMAGHQGSRILAGAGIGVGVGLLTAVTIARLEASWPLGRSRSSSQMFADNGSLNITLLVTGALIGGGAGTRWDNGLWRPVDVATLGPRVKVGVSVLPEKRATGVGVIVGF